MVAYLQKKQFGKFLQDILNGTFGFQQLLNMYYLRGYFYKKIFINSTVKQNKAYNNTRMTVLLVNLCIFSDWCL